ncbi:hypothetical protein EV702DRAFT_963261 [Suillus placidus]|uniref:DNA helicase n=1 Tax=Suillus placidus TaxID=48579 RepID=A0A9P7D5C2_9AGAM|nr:hypothetical protein EV702DRAFT_963261 [Suillus placidus]
MGSADYHDTAAIVATNAVREVLNAHKAAASCTANKKLVVCAALDKCTGQELSCEECDMLLKLNVGGLKSSSPLPGHVTLYEGMPIVLRLHNLSTDLGITNGLQGVVRTIWTDICPAGFTYATCVLVHFPDSKIHLTGLPPAHYPIILPHGPLPPWSVLVQLFLKS